MSVLWSSLWPNLIVHIFNLKLCDVIHLYSPTDECSKRGYSYTWCTKAEPSNVGTWSTTDYCTTEPDSTPFGEKCSDKCEQRGEPYFWCHKVNIVDRIICPKLKAFTICSNTGAIQILGFHSSNPILYQPFLQYAVNLKLLLLVLLFTFSIIWNVNR